MFDRNDFPMLKQNIIYFDNGATTFKPQSVIDSIIDYYQNYTANAHRGDYAISYKVDQIYENTRANIAAFINANNNEVVFTSGTTEGLNLIAQGFFANILKENDEIIITKSEHASNVLPWFRLANKYNLNIKYIPLNKDLHVTMDALKSIINKNTKVISLAEITNVVGDIRPMKEIAKYAHEHGIYVVCDAAQSISHKKIDVKNMDLDFMAFSGHKMCGPTGIGILYGKEELLDQIDPLILGGGMNESFDNEESIYLKELPLKLEAGTQNIAGVIGLNSAIDYLNAVGMDNIQEYISKLSNYLIKHLNEINHIKLLTTSSENGIIAFNIEGIFSQDVAFYLNKYNICVRAGNHCAKLLKDVTGVTNSIRISLYAYNTFEEIDRLIELLKDKDKIMKEMI